MQCSALYCSTVHSPASLWPFSAPGLLDKGEGEEGGRTGGKEAVEGRKEGKQEIRRQWKGGRREGQEIRGQGRAVMVNRSQASQEGVGQLRISSLYL